MPPAAPIAPSATPPNQTLYISNLPDTKIRKPDLRLALYTLFSTYGVVLDVVALLTMKHRGQAHVVFRDVASATSAMRELQGFKVFGKEIKIQYARGKSHKLMKLEGSFAPVRKQDAPAAGGAAFVPLPGSTPAAAAGVKRPREDEEEGDGREGATGRTPPGQMGGPQVGQAQAQQGQGKKVDKVEEEESEGEEMEMDEDDD